MSYDKEELEKKAVSAIKRHKLAFIQDVVVYLPCTKSTFYSLDLHELDSIKDELELVRTKKKISLRSKWEEGDNATLHVALYKLIGTEEEADRLGAKQKTELTGKDGGALEVALTRVVEPGE